MITQCPQCGGLRAEPGESYAGKPCECQFVPAHGSVALTITLEELWDINDLVQRVLKSRQNVGHPMRFAAIKVEQICKRVNRHKPLNNEVRHAGPDVSK